MKRYKIVESGHVFKSARALDQFFHGPEGMTVKMVNHEGIYGLITKPHVIEITENEYQKHKHASFDDEYDGLFHTFQIPCKWCGNMFHPDMSKSRISMYCDRKHYKTCECCGEKFDITELLKQNKDIPKTCSKECADKLKSSSKLELFQNSKYKEHFNSARKHTTIERYGVDNVSKKSEIINRAIDTKIRKYGSAFTERNQKGIEAYYADEERVQIATEKKKQTMIKHYGVDWYTQSIESHLKYGISPKSTLKIQEWYRDPIAYIQNHFDHKPTIHELALHFGTKQPYDSFNSTGILDNYVEKYKSHLEIEVEQFLKSIDPNIIIIHNTRSVIKPLEIDLWLPDYRIGIECNPTVTHNSSITLFENGRGISSTYHRRKTDLAEKNNLFIFHLWGTDWKLKRSIVESMIRNLLHKDTHRIFARKCEVRNVDFKDTKKFLYNNHRQGWASSSVNLGLYFEDDLVSLMTFSHRRHTIGSSITGNTEWELLRFCSKMNTSVVGGASKLFHYFIETYEPQKVISFSDRATTRGTLYVNLGMKEIKRSDSGYVWATLDDSTVINRIQTQKHKLRDYFYDESIDLLKTEKQIMEEHGYVQVFDSGTITWEWKATHNKN